MPKEEQENSEENVQEEPISLEKKPIIRGNRYRFKKQELKEIFNRYKEHQKIGVFREDIAPFICFYATKLTKDQDQQQEFILQAMTNCEACLRTFQKHGKDREFAPYLARFLKNTYYSLYKRRKKNGLQETLLENIESMPQASLVGGEMIQEHNVQIKLAFRRNRHVSLNFLEKLPIESRTILKLYHGIDLTRQEKNAIQILVSDSRKQKSFNQRYQTNLRTLHKRILNLRKEQQKFALTVRQFRQLPQQKALNKNALMRKENKKLQLKVMERRIMQSQLATMEDIGNLMEISKSTVYRRIQSGYQFIYRSYHSPENQKPGFGGA